MKFQLECAQLFRAMFDLYQRSTEISFAPSEVHSESATHGHVFQSFLTYRDLPRALVWHFLCNALLYEAITLGTNGRTSGIVRTIPREEME